MKIIVLGCGLVPRIGGIAPIRKPVEVDENILRLILGHGSLKPYKVNDDGTKEEITFANFRKMLEESKPKKPVKKEEPKKPEVKVEPKKEEPKPEKPVEEKKEEKKQDKPSYEKKDDHKQNAPKVMVLDETN